MNRLDVVEMYRQGYSINYIVNKFFNSEKFYSKIINTTNKRIIIINSPIKKGDIRAQVYRIIYEEKKQKGRPI